MKKTTLTLSFLFLTLIFNNFLHSQTLEGSSVTLQELSQTETVVDGDASVPGEFEVSPDLSFDIDGNQIIFSLRNSSSVAIPINFTFTGGTVTGITSIAVNTGASTVADTSGVSASVAGSGIGVTLNISSVSNASSSFQQVVFDLVITGSAPNTDPSISINNLALSYTEGNTATQIDASATVNDADGDADWNSGTLTAQIVVNNEAADEISISDTDGDGTAITVSGTNILANGTDIGDLSVMNGIVTNGTILTITFDSNATNANVQEVLQSLRYRNTSTTPGTANRTINITANDNNGGSANDTRIVSIATVAPATPTVNTPSAAITVNAATQTIAGSHPENGVTVHAYADANNDGVADNTSSLGSATVTGNAWSFSVNLNADADNNFVVSATDGVDTSSDADVPTITEDSTNPANPIVNTPSAAITVNAATQTLSGTLTENGVTVHAYADADNDGTADNATSLGSATVSGNAWSFSVNLTADSDNNFVVRAEDNAGNASSDVDIPTITEDSTSPANPVVNTPSAAITVNAATQTLSGTLTENGVTVHAYADADNNGVADNTTSLGSATVSGNAWSFSVNLNADADNNFVVRAEDNAGNASSDVDIPTITEDSTSPANPVVNTPSAAITVNAATQTLSGTLTENGVTVHAYADADNNGVADNSTSLGSAVVSGNTWSFSVNLNTDSDNNFVVRAEDNAGNASSDVDIPTITEDSTSPANPVVNTPSAAITVNVATQTLSGTLTENGVTVHAYADADNNGVADNTTSLGSATVSGNAWSFSVNLNADADNNFVVRAEDSAGNTSSDVDIPTITEDSTSPANPVVNTPSAAITVNAVTQTLSGTLTENGVTVHAYADADNDGTADNTSSLGSAVVSGNTWSFSVNLTADSDNNFVVRAEDNAGNASSDVDVPTITQTSTITWTGTTSSSWNTAGNWNTNSIPNSSANVMIPDGVTNYPTISSAVTVNSINIASNASLIANASVTGTVTYNRNLPTTNWYLVAAPVSGETTQDIIANHTFASGTGGNIGIGAFDNDSATDPWTYSNAGTTGPVIAGAGVSMKLAAAGDVSITGNLNVTNVSVFVETGSRNNFNLIGNPFTSYINSSVLAGSNVVIDNATFWLWDGSQYVTYNNASPINIAPAQGFFIEANTNTNVTFSTANQIHKTTNTFMRQGPKASFDLFVESDSNKSSTKVFFIKDKTTGYDYGYDSKMFGGTNYNFAVFTQLASDDNGEKLAIQTLPDNNYDAIVIPVGLTANQGKKIDFSINSQSIPTGVDIYLEDRSNNTFTNLSQENYSLTLKNDSNGIGQFYIHMSPKSLSSEDIDQNIKKISIYKSSSKEITITGLQGEAKVNVYSLLGEEMLNTDIKSNGTSSIALNNFANGIYIVRLNSSLGSITKKIVLE
ncbi:beta strand repeat-containing protein [Tenacibaculum sp. M341]|uniref:beta strand repeat-containing protein n=1 Tax=Tenacibaculum sp. M341 TaxID=2530339 RepID=UPI00104C91BA|nr:T9SS type A sorting domain-containing protein [Tenacibaculum sp. M341]TCI85346.1 T9SS type A sorting domain-containing protein [Tenacibaculum sp. M341]